MLPLIAAVSIAVRLTEWSVAVAGRVPSAGRVTFVVTNAGQIPHGFEVEGRGLEREIESIRPGATDSLTVTLRAGTYELYCPVGDGSHRRLGMVTHLVVGTRGTAGQGDSETGTTAPRTQTIEVASGGPVIQILPGPFPFADSAAAVIASRPADQQADLTHKAHEGPYSNNVAPASGTFAFRAWDTHGPRDSVAGEATFRTADGARWHLVLTSIQTRDIPDNPRFGGVIMGLYYHGASGVHTPLVPTINSAVALWSYGRLWKNDSLVTDTAMVHVMLLSRTRRPPDWSLACWDCSHQPIEELQLQVTPSPGQPAFPAPGGVLFVNWERSRARPARTGRS